MVAIITEKVADLSVLPFYKKFNFITTGLAEESSKKEKKKKKKNYHQ